MDGMLDHLDESQTTGYHNMADRKKEKKTGGRKKRVKKSPMINHPPFPQPHYPSFKAR